LLESIFFAKVSGVERAISQRHLRNHCPAIMRELSAGESFVITRHGVPVGRLTPIIGRMFIPTAELKEAFANLPPIDYGQFRADIDAHIDQNFLPGDDR